MLRVVRTGLLVSLILSLGGCPTGPQMSQVNVGMARDQVIGIMGRPTVIRSWTQ